MSDQHFTACRVRIYPDLAKIEVDASELEKFWLKRQEITSQLQQLGFKSIALDLQGYRRGAVNGAENTGEQ